MTIAMMPLRGGSKGIKRKNIKKFINRPLYHWNMQALVDSGVCDKIYANTDDDEIAVDVEVNFPEVFVVFSDIHSDISTTMQVVNEFLEDVSGDDIFILSQATAPYLKPADVMVMRKAVENGNCDSAMSGADFHRFVWDPNTGESITGPKYNRRPRQARDPLFLQNGCIYVSRVKTIKETGCLWGGNIGFYIQDYGFEMDSMEDWQYGEVVINAARNNRQ